jgi:hypothetical protein
MIITIIIFIAVLSILVFVHELGHFLAAKLFGMRVDKFSIGFPPKIWARKVGDTVYSFLHGQGRVCSINNSPTHPIWAGFAYVALELTSDGKAYHNEALPMITLTPWNPMAGEPFPFPKFEPILGDVYAFWDDREIEFFQVAKLIGFNDLIFRDATNYVWSNCAPIDQAMHIFGFDEPQQP